MLRGKDPQTWGASFVGCDKGSTELGAGKNHGVPQSQNVITDLLAVGEPRNQHPTGYLRVSTVGLGDTDEWPILRNTHLVMGRRVLPKRRLGWLVEL